MMCEGAVVQQVEIEGAVLRQVGLGADLGVLKVSTNQWEGKAETAEVNSLCNVGAAC